MKNSLFVEFLKGFALVVAKIYQKINGENDEQVYLHKSLFQEEYSVDGKFSSLTGDVSRISADIVPLDSSLPLKKVGSIKKVDGEIPKLGMKMVRTENRLKEWLILRGLGRVIQLVDKIYDDVTSVVRGVEELKEYLAFQAISKGIILVPDGENAGIGVRVDFNVSANNKFAPKAIWSDPAATPLDDIERMIDYADEIGRTPNVVWMDKATSRLMLKNESVQKFYGAYAGFDVNNVPVPNLGKLNEALAADDRPTISVIDRSVTFQKNGINTSRKVWSEGMVVAGTAGILGSMVYTDLAEETFSAEQVTYAKAGTHILVSKYHKIDPLEEFTSSQAAVCPVLNDVDGLFYLDTNDAATIIVGQTEDDANIDIDGSTTVSREAFITALNNVGVTKASDRNKDETLVGYYNDLDLDDQTAVNTELGI